MKNLISCVFKRSNAQRKNFLKKLKFQDITPSGVILRRMVKSIIIFFLLFIG